MNVEDFYKLNADDMYECLRRLRLKYNFRFISVVDLQHLTNKIMKGFKPDNLKDYLFGMNREGKKNQEKLEKELYEKVGEYDYVNNRYVCL